MYRWKFLNSIVEDVHHHLDTTTHFLLSNKTRKSLKCGRNPERFRMVRWSRKYQSGKWTLPLLAWCTSADPAVERSGIRDERNIRRRASEAPYFNRQKIGRRRVRASCHCQTDFPAELYNVLAHVFGFRGEYFRLSSADRPRGLRESRTRGNR